MKLKNYLNENEKVLNEGTMTVDEFTAKLKSTIKKHFPKSKVEAWSSTNLGSSISLSFALGKDKSEWVNGIIENDPLLHRFMIGWNSFAEGRFIKDKIQAELTIGGSMLVEPEEGSRMAYGRKKIGWRKKTDTPEKIITHFDNYFKKMKKVLKDSIEDMPKKHYELNKNKV
jgi:hypothetical protein